MFRKKCQFAAFALCAFAAATSPASAASTITVAVTPVAADAVTDLVADFIAAYPSAGYSVSLNIISDAEAKAAIIAGADPVPDLFLSQSYLAPRQLAAKYPSLVSGAAFAYAIDRLVLYSSADKNVDVTAGLPSYETLQKFSMPDPELQDPYGLAALQILGTDYSRAVTDGLVLKTPDASGAAAAISFLDAFYGFTSLSQVCTATTGKRKFEKGSHYHLYGGGVDYLNNIILAGVKIARTRLPAEETELTDFVNFMLGAGSINFTQHCFKALTPAASAALSAP